VFSLVLSMILLDEILSHGQLIIPALMLGKIEGGRKGWQRMRWMTSLTQWT